MFQHYALFRHMSVFENVAFGLRVQPRATREDEATIRARVKNLLDLVQLDWLANRYPSQLSGGQRQRIALARALAIEPRILLLDEPFGALDAKVRKELRHWLRSLHDEIHVTSIFVTHDQEEALEVANRVVVMDKGKIEQIGTPGDVYDNPGDRLRAWLHRRDPSCCRSMSADDAVRLDGRSLEHCRRSAWRPVPRSCSSAVTTWRSVRPVPAHSKARIRHVRSFGPIQRAEVALSGSEGKTVIEIDAPRDRNLQAGEIVSLQTPPLPDLCRAGLERARPGARSARAFTGRWPWLFLGRHVAATWE